MVPAAETLMVHPSALVRSATGGVKVIGLVTVQVNDVLSVNEPSLALMGQ